MSETSPYAYGMVKARTRISVCYKGGWVFRSTSGNSRILPIECPCMIQIVLKCKNLFHELVFPTLRTFSGSVPHSISWGASVVLTSLSWRLQWRSEANRSGSNFHSPPGCFSVGEFPTYSRFTHGHFQWTKQKRQYSKSNSDSVTLWGESDFWDSVA